MIEMHAREGVEGIDGLILVGETKDVVHVSLCATHGGVTVVRLDPVAAGRLARQLEAAQMMATADVWPEDAT